MKRYDLEYRGAQLRVEVTDKLLTSLYINGMCRDSRSPAVSGQCSLSSTVQTDYEWHEFIEGIIEFGHDEISARLLGNKQEIASLTVQRSIS